jgi:hypothetical protein
VNPLAETGGDFLELHEEFPFVPQFVLRQPQKELFQLVVLAELGGVEVPLPGLPLRLHGFLKNIEELLQAFFHGAPRAKEKGNGERQKVKGEK